MTATVVIVAPAACMEMARSVKVARRTRDTRGSSASTSATSKAVHTASPSPIGAPAPGPKGTATKRVWAHTAVTATLPAIVAHTSSRERRRRPTNRTAAPSWAKPTT